MLSWFMTLVCGRRARVSVYMCGFLTWGRVGGRLVARLCVFLIGTRGGPIGWFGYLVISYKDMIGWCDTWSVARRSDDVAFWPESQRDGLDNLDPYLAADLFSTWDAVLCGCVHVYRPLKDINFNSKKKLDNKERCRHKMNPDAR